MNQITLPEVVHWLEQQPTDRRFTLSNMQRCVIATYVADQFGLLRHQVAASRWDTKVQRHPANCTIGYPHDSQVRAFIRAFDALPGEDATRDQALDVARAVLASPPADLILELPPRVLELGQSQVAPVRETSHA